MFHNFFNEVVFSLFEAFALFVEVEAVDSDCAAEFLSASLNVLTASPHEMLDPCLKRLGLYDLFDNVWSCEDFATTKADPAIYLAVADRLGTNVDNIIFVDDNKGAIETALSAGVKVYGIYDDSSSEMVNDIKSIANGYVYNFRELLDM